MTTIGKISVRELETSIQALSPRDKALLHVIAELEQAEEGFDFANEWRDIVEDASIEEFVADASIGALLRAYTATM